MKQFCDLIYVIACFYLIWAATWNFDAVPHWFWVGVIVVEIADCLFQKLEDYL